MVSLKKLTCPDGVSRKSLALYHYMAESESVPIPKSTDYRARPCDSIKHSALIWLDKTAVHFYSMLKSRLGLSDTLASRILVFSIRDDRSAAWKS